MGLNVKQQKAGNVETAEKARVASSTRNRSALELLRNVAKDAFSVRNGVRALESEVSAKPSLPAPRGRCFPESMTPTHSLGHVTESLGALFQAVGLFLHEIGGQAAHPALTFPPLPPVAPPSANSVVLASPLKSEQLVVILEQNHVALSRHDLLLISQMDEHDKALFVAGKLADLPQEAQPPGVEAKLMLWLSPIEQSRLLFQKSVARREGAFHHLMDALQHGEPLPPEDEQQAMQLLDDRQRLEYLSAKARLLQDRPPSGAPEIANVREAAVIEGKAYTSLLSMIAQGGPRNGSEERLFDRYMREISPEHRAQAFRAMHHPELAPELKRTASRQLRVFTGMLDMLQRNGPASPMLAVCESTCWSELSNLQRAQYLRLKAGMGVSDSAPTWRAASMAQDREVGPALSQSPEAVAQLVALSSASTLLERHQQEVSLLRVRPIVTR